MEKMLVSASRNDMFYGKCPNPVVLLWCCMICCIPQIWQLLVCYVQININDARMNIIPDRIVIVKLRCLLFWNVSHCQTRNLLNHGNTHRTLKTSVYGVIPQTYVSRSRIPSTIKSIHASYWCIRYISRGYGEK